MPEEFQQNAGGQAPSAGPGPAAPASPKKPGSSKALWIVLGCAGCGFVSLIGAAILAGLLVPAIARSREGARRASCMSNLRQIGQACQMFAVKENRFPAKLDELVPGYVQTSRLFDCPSGRGGYVYLPGRRAGMSGEFVLAYEEPENHNGAGFNVLYLDCRVEWWPARRLGEFNRLIEEQERKIRGMERKK